MICFSDGFHGSKKMTILFLQEEENIDLNSILEYAERIQRQQELFKRAWKKKKLEYRNDGGEESIF